MRRWPVHHSAAVCPADPSKGEVKVNARGPVPLLLLNRGPCSCPDASYWLCYLEGGRECSAASCQFIGRGRFAQIYGLRSGAAYRYAVAGACGDERDEDVKALLCNAGSRFNGRFQLPAAGMLYTHTGGVRMVAGLDSCNYGVN